MLWIKEVEMVDSVDELKTSRSIAGKNFRFSNCWTRKSLQLWTRSYRNSHFKKKVSLEEQKAQKEDRFLPAITLTYFPSIFVMMMFRNSMRDGMKFHYPWPRSHLMISWKVCTNSGYVSLINSKTVLELYDMEIYQKISRLEYLKMKTMVRRSIDQKLWLRNFDSRHEKIEQVQWSRVKRD